MATLLSYPAGGDILWQTLAWVRDERLFGSVTRPGLGVSINLLHNRGPGPLRGTFSIEPLARIGLAT